MIQKKVPISAITLALLYFIFTGVARAQLLDTLSVSAIDSCGTANPEAQHLRIVFAGDIMGHDSQIEGAWDPETQSYNYEPTFRYIRDYISSADIAVGNLEVTLAGPPYKGYPQFSSPDALAQAAKNAGFDILVNANNHALDRGEKGLLRTLDMMDSLQFLHAGTYRDSAERAAIHPLVFEKNAIRIALLNYTYGTNGLTVSPPREINRIDTAVIREDLLKAKSARPDITIVCIHWGIEYQREENAQQKTLARFIFRQGADAVIGSHPHVVQPIRYYGMDEDSILVQPVVFSMGNFVSNQRARYKDGGIMVELFLSKSDSSSRIDSLQYLPYWVWRQDKNTGRSVFYVLPVAKYEAAPDSLELLPGDVYRLKQFAGDTRDHLKGISESEFYHQKATIPVETADKAD